MVVAWPDQSASRVLQTKLHHICHRALVSPQPPRSSPAPSGCLPVYSTRSASLGRWATAIAGWHSPAPRSATWRRPVEPSGGTGRGWPTSCPVAAGFGWHCRPRRSVWVSPCHQGRWPHPTERKRDGNNEMSLCVLSLGERRHMIYKESGPKSKNLCVFTLCSQQWDFLTPLMTGLHSTGWIIGRGPFPSHCWYSILKIITIFPIINNPLELNPPFKSPMNVGHQRDLDIRTFPSLIT